MHLVGFHAALLLFLAWALGVSTDYTTTTTPTTCRTSYAATSVADVATVSTSATLSETYTAANASTLTPLFRVVPPTVTLTTTAQALLLRKETVAAVSNTVTTTTTQTRTIRTTIATSTVSDVSVYTNTYETRLFIALSTGPAAIVTPVQDTLSGSTRKRRRGVGDGPNLNRRQAGAQYPNAVTCTVVTKEITVIEVTSTAPTLSYTIAGATVFRTVTTLQPTTSTYYPANTFPTVTSTVVTTTTISVTRTTTAISYLVSSSVTINRVATAYPQCTGRNVAQYLPNRAHWNGYQAVDTSTTDRTWTAPYTTVEECCSYCFEDPTCSHIYFYYRPGGTGCTLFSKPNGVCDATNPLLYKVRLTTYLDAYDIVSNGKCGRWVGSVGP